jgi:two-component system response regulator
MTDLDFRDILLVEDNPMDAELTVRALKKFRVVNRVVHVDDGTKALDFLFCRKQYASRPKINPSLVLLDLNLPKMDGIEVLRAIRADPWTQGLAVFVLTGSMDERNFVEANRLEVTDYLLKPVEFVNFAGVVAKAGMEWGLFEQESP